MAEACDSGYLNICEKLDKLAIEILKTMQNIINERRYLDGNLKEGFICLAKSRYLMRGQKINTCQINTSNLHSSKKVVTNSESFDDIKFSSFCLFDDLQTVNGSVRNRSHFFAEDKICNLKDDSEKCDENDDTQDFSDEPKYSFHNPLNWFGVLVPTALKNCQSKFEQAVETSVKLVSLQCQLKALSKEYRNVRSQKLKF